MLLGMFMIFEYKNKILKTTMILASMTLAGCSTTMSNNTNVDDEVGSNAFVVESNQKPTKAVLNQCIDELSALKSLSRDDYNVLRNSFKEVSEINQLYKRIAATTTPETKALLQMSIEAKTTMLCAKVRYSSILSTESILEQVDVI